MKKPNRFTNLCPICTWGENDPNNGGNKKCFHCNTCWFTECDTLSENREEQIKEILDGIERRLRQFFYK